MAFKDRYEIDASLAERAIKGLNKSLDVLEKTSEKGAERLSRQEKAARRLNEQADPTLKYARKMEELAGAVQKGGVQMDNAKTLALKYTQQLDRAQGAGNRAFGNQSINQLSQYVGQLVTVGGAVAGIKRLFTEVNQVADESAQRIRASLDAVGELQQLGDTAGSKAFIKRLRKGGVFTDEGQAANFTSAIKSAGFSDKEREFLAFDLVGTRFVKPGDAVQTALSAKKSQELLGISDFETAFQKFTAASGPTSAKIPQLAEAVTKFGANFTALGYGEDAAIAAISVADKGSPNINTAAERLKSFTNSVRKRDLDKGSFRATVDSINQRVRSGESPFAILGEAVAVDGYQLFDEARELSLYDRAVKEVASAPERDVIGSRLTLQGDPQFAAAQLRTRSEGSLAVAEEEVHAEARNLYAAVRAQTKEAAVRRGSLAYQGFEYGISPAISNAAYYALGPRGYLRSELDADQPGDAGRLDSGLEDDIRAYLARTAAATEESAAALKGSINPSEE